MSGTRTAVVVGNPKPESRTLAAALHLHKELVGADPDLVVDLATIGAGLLDWSDPTIGELVEQVGAADVVVVASPTYKATYTGLLKLFLDRFAVGQLSGVTVPLMLGGGPAHALAPEQGLTPLLAHLGGTVPAGGLYVLDKQFEEPEAYAAYVERNRPLIQRLVAPDARAPA